MTENEWVHQYVETLDLEEVMHASDGKIEVMAQKMKEAAQKAGVELSDAVDELMVLRDDMRSETFRGDEE